MQIIGHKKSIEFLNKSLENKKLSHAYFFYGPKHIGKTKVAEYFIMNIFCQKKSDLQICFKCPNCEQILKKNHADILWIKEEDKIIGIDQVRNIKNFIFSTPFAASYKAVIIEEVDNLSLPAANSLLKFLEEPPVNSIIILISRNFNYLPLTIRSRCQVLRFSLPGKEEIISFLQNEFSLKKEKIQEILTLSLARPGLAIDFAKNFEILKKEKELVEKMIKLLNNKNFESNFKLAELILNSEISLEKNLDSLLNILRKTVLVQNKFSFRSDLFFSSFEKLAQLYSSKKLSHFITQILKTKYLIKANVNQRLAIENLLINQ